MKKVIAMLSLVAVLSLSPAGGQTFAYSDIGVSSGLATEAGSRLTLIMTATPSLSVSSKTATYSLRVTCNSSVNSIRATLQLQKWNGSKWVDYGTHWTASSSKSTLNTDGTKTVDSGNTYRLKVSITASNGTTSETTTVYSG